MSEDRTALVEAHISAPDADVARRIGQDLVARQVAACVQILGPMASIYSWQGQVQQSQEWLLLAKTTEEAFPRLVEVVSALHPYDVPEIIAVPIRHASGDYADWVRRHADGIDDDELRSP